MIHEGLNSMLKKSMTSKERILAAFTRKPVDYVPCSPFYNFLNPIQRIGHKYKFLWGISQKELIDYNVNVLGTDPFVTVDIYGYACDSEITSQVWIDNGILHKKYYTPSGELHAAVKYNEKWPHGYDIPLFSDFNVGHYVEAWIKSYNDLECLKHVMKPMKGKDDINQIRLRYKEARDLANLYGELPVITSIGMGLAGAMHLFGAEGICIAAIDEPELVDSYLEIEHKINLYYMEMAVDLGVDIIRRNGFYETCDYYSPYMLDKFLYKRLQKEIELVHQGGKVIGYTVNTGVMPMLDYLSRLDFDCIMHIDIAHNHTNIKKINTSLGTRKSFWIGPSSVYHIYNGSPEDVRKAVNEVFHVFGKTGLIITACPSTHSIIPWENTVTMIDEWKKLKNN